MTIRPLDSGSDERRSRLQAARGALARLVSVFRRRAKRDSLRTTVGILRAQQDATLDGILVIDSKGAILSYNRRFLEIWGVPADVAAGADDNELLGYAAEVVADWDSFIELVNYLYNHPEEVRTGDEVRLKDGRTLERSTVPVMSAGRSVGRAWYFRDVSDVRRAETLQSALFRIAQLS